MIKKPLMMSALVTALFIPSGFALAGDDPTPEQEMAQNQMQEQKQIYGSELMTEEERIEHRAKMRAAKTVEEREEIRKEHHEQMKERAKERGVSIPEMPPAKGGGMGYGGGRMGPGKGRYP